MYGNSAMAKEKKKKKKPCKVSLSDGYYEPMSLGKHNFNNTAWCHATRPGDLLLKHSINSACQIGLQSMLVRHYKPLENDRKAVCLIS